MTPPPITRSQAHVEINKKLVRWVPELDSDYGLTPLQFDRWRQPEEKLDSGEPCFLPAERDEGIKKDYIYVAKRRGMKDEHVGYYHLRTQEAHVLAYQRLLSEHRPSVWRRCQCRADPDYAEVKRLLYNRSVSPEPDDVVAARFALLGAQTGRDVAGRFGHASLFATLAAVLLLGAAAH